MANNILVDDVTLNVPQTSIGSIEYTLLSGRGDVKRIGVFINSSDLSVLSKTTINVAINGVNVIENVNGQAFNMLSSDILKIFNVDPNQFNARSVVTLNVNNTNAATAVLVQLVFYYV